VSAVDDFQDSLALIRPRPLVVRIVHRETDAVASEFPIDPDKTPEEIRRWVAWLEENCGAKHEIEIPNQSTTEERTP